MSNQELNTMNEKLRNLLEKCWKKNKKLQSEFDEKCENRENAFHIEMKKAVENFEKEVAHQNKEWEQHLTIFSNDIARRDNVIQQMNDEINIMKSQNDEVKNKLGDMIDERDRSIIEFKDIQQDLIQLCLSNEIDIPISLNTKIIKTKDMPTTHKAPKKKRRGGRG